MKLGVSHHWVTYWPICIITFLKGVKLLAFMPLVYMVVIRSHRYVSNVISHINRDFFSIQCNIPLNREICLSVYSSASLSVCMLIHESVRPFIFRKKTVSFLVIKNSWTISDDKVPEWEKRINKIMKEDVRKICLFSIFSELNNVIN